MRNGRAASRSQPTSRTGIRGPNPNFSLRRAMIIILHRLRCITKARRIFLLMMLLATGVSAQTSHSTDGTTPLGLAPGSPSGSYALNGFDNINLFNGNVNVTLPMLHIGGRGGAQTTMMAALNTKHWHMETYQTAATTPYYPHQGGWSTPNPGF